MKISIAAAMPDVVSLPEHINISPGTWYVAIDLGNAFFCIPVIKTTRSSLLSAGQASNTPSLSSLRGIYSLVLDHNLVSRDLDCFSFPQDITLVHYIDDIMLPGLSEQKVTITQDFAKEFVCQRVKNKCDKNLGTIYLIEISGGPLL